MCGEDEPITCYNKNCNEEATIGIYWEDEHISHFVWENTPDICLGFYWGCDIHALKFLRKLFINGKKIEEIQLSRGDYTSYTAKHGCEHFYLGNRGIVMNKEYIDIFYGSKIFIVEVK